MITIKSVKYYIYNASASNQPCNQVIASPKKQGKEKSLSNTSRDFDSLTTQTIILVLYAHDCTYRGLRRRRSYLLSGRKARVRNRVRQLV